MSGHGHVTPNPDGTKARCGGPGMCSVCAREYAAKAVMGQRIHELKVWPGYWERLNDGTKTFEIRKNDREFLAGDELELREWNQHSEGYTGRRLRAVVTYVAHGGSFGLERGYVVMGLRIRNFVEVGT